MVDVVVVCGAEHSGAPFSRNRRLLIRMHMLRGCVMFLIDDGRGGRASNIIKMLLDFLIFVPSATGTSIDDASVTNFVQPNIGPHVLHAPPDYIRTQPTHWIGPVEFNISSIDLFNFSARMWQ